MIYDYYIIDVPGDCADTIEELADIAILEARERAKLYCMPCDWRATVIEGEVGCFNVRFKVRRRRNRVKRVALSAAFE
jgi:hypothetical protein